MTCQKYVVYPAHLVHDFTPEVGRFRIRNMSLGPYGEICVLAINRDPVRSEQTSFGGGKKDYIYNPYFAPCGGLKRQPFFWLS